ncbi:hypothetical protein [Streptomyces tsukubensis]|uniref:hypothetical protein n=1 Tax=Streptomyces tsukubensis TaxID=83656 RepID=UPI00344E93BD
MTEQNAADIIADWLLRDTYKLTTARRYANAGPEYLGNWCRQVLYPPSFLPLHPEDAVKLTAVRDSFTREAFAAIDWAAVAAGLDHDGECLLCGAPGGYPYCNAQCEAANGA